MSRIGFSGLEFCLTAWLNLVQTARDIRGNAVSDEYHIGRHVSNLFVTQTYEGQSDIHSKSLLYCTKRKILIGRRLDIRKSHHRHTGFCMTENIKSLALRSKEYVFQEVLERL